MTDVDAITSDHKSSKPNFLLPIVYVLAIIVPLLMSMAVLSFEEAYPIKEILQSIQRPRTGHEEQIYLQGPLGGLAFAMLMLVPSIVSCVLVFVLQRMRRLNAYFKIAMWFIGLPLLMYVILYLCNRF
jgi:hypothetical protein